MGEKKKRRKRVKGGKKGNLLREVVLLTGQELVLWKKKCKTVLTLPELALRALQNLRAQLALHCQHFQQCQQFQKKHVWQSMSTKKPTKSRTKNLPVSLLPRSVTTFHKYFKHNQPSSVKLFIPRSFASPSLYPAQSPSLKHTPPTLHPHSITSASHPSTAHSTQHTRMCVFADWRCSQGNHSS